MGDNYQQLVKVTKVLELVSPSVIKSYVDKYRADFSANKLHTVIFLRLFLYAWMFSRNDLSLRTIATYSDSRVFKQVAGLEKEFSVGKSSLSERLANIPWSMFQELFDDLAKRAFTILPTNTNASNAAVNQLIAQSRVLDSTIIRLSAQLIQSGLKINEKDTGIKASVAICGKQIPVKTLVFTEKTYGSENHALPALFDFSQRDIIYLFDRGIQKIKIYADIARNGSYFITRLTAKNYQVVATNTLPEVKETETLTVLSDEIIIFPQLTARTDKNRRFRLITTVSKKDQKTLRFITNLEYIEATDITDVYRFRWSIEVFFRFLKSELHLEKLLSYSNNGIRVHIYLTLIAFILTWVYKEQNKIQSFKRARERLGWFLLELLMEQQFQEGLLLGATLTELIDSS